MGEASGMADEIGISIIAFNLAAKLFHGVKRKGSLA